MSTDQGHPADEGAHDPTDAHGDGHADDHGHGGTALGPVDLRMWGVGLVGVVLGLVSAAVFAISTGRL